METCYARPPSCPTQMERVEIVIFANLEMSGAAIQLFYFHFVLCYSRNNQYTNADTSNRPLLLPIIDFTFAFVPFDRQCVYHCSSFC